MRSNNPQKAIAVQKIFIEQFVSLPFDDECAENYGKIRADLANYGTTISSNDIQIASIAIDFATDDDLIEVVNEK